MIKNWIAFNESNEIKENGVCVCKVAPMGEAGLEGFEEKEEYFYQLKVDTTGKEYYKIFHDKIYGETCGVKTFKRFFHIKQKA